MPRQKRIHSNPVNPNGTPAEEFEENPQTQKTNKILSKEEKQQQKAEDFRKFANHRLRNLKKELDWFTKLSNNNSYPYTSDQVEKLFNFLYQEVDKSHDKFLERFKENKKEYNELEII